MGFVKRGELANSGEVFIGEKIKSACVTIVLCETKVALCGSVIFL